MNTAFLIISACFVAALVALALWAHVMFPIRGERPRHLTVTCADGWQLAVWHRAAPVRRFAEPVVLCHGLANNHRVFELHSPVSLAQALCEAGFECYSVDLRGAGLSQRAPPGAKFHASVDDHIRYDAPAVIDFVRARHGGAKVHWVGHSLGGLVGLASADARVSAQLAGVVTIASPVFFKVEVRTRLALALGRFFSYPRRIHLDVLARLALPIAGIAPAALTEGMLNARNVDAAVRRLSLAQMIAPIWRGVLLQLADWVANDAFRSLDGTVDYRERIARLTVPLLTVGGAVDRLAPLDVVTKAHALAGSPDKTLLIEWPDGISYGHGDLLIGRHSHVHVYAKIIAWLQAHATALSADSTEARPARPGESLPSADTPG